MRNAKKVARLDPASLTKLIEAASPGWRPYLFTCAYTGARASEVLALRWADVDTSAGLVHIRAQLGREGQLVPLKTEQSKRTIRMAPELRAVLREWKIASYHSKESDFVFGTRKGKPRSYHTRAEPSMRLPMLRS